tara:strand:- start:89 stop:190 length:102 start_codon:yes stop_codon:yes gene_type:complete
VRGALPGYLIEDGELNVGALGPYFEALAATEAR